jgi:hypothetical protein
VVFVAAVREVHPDHIEPSFAKLVDSLDRVGLGADGADDRSPAQVALRLVGRVKLRQPFDLAAELEMVESGCHCLMVDGSRRIRIMATKFLEGKICGFEAWED